MIGKTPFPWLPFAKKSLLEFPTREAFGPSALAPLSSAFVSQIYKSFWATASRFLCFLPFQTLHPFGLLRWPSFILLMSQRTTRASHLSFQLTNGKQGHRLSWDLAAS